MSDRNGKYLFTASTAELEILNHMIANMMGSLYNIKYSNTVLTLLTEGKRRLVQQRIADNMAGIPEPEFANVESIPGLIKSSQIRALIIEVSENAAHLALHSEN
jgi:hypothetical protein